MRGVGLVGCRWAVLTLALLSGCAWLAGGPLQPTRDTAVVRAGEWGKVYRGGYVEIASINGVASGWRLHSDLQVTPGILHGVFYVFLCTQDSKHCTVLAQSQMTFKAEARYTYRLLAREQVHGTNRFWVWVVDEASNAVVGGTAPDAAS
jgi:hypothetical protein